MLTRITSAVLFLYTYLRRKCVSSVRLKSVDLAGTDRWYKIYRYFCTIIKYFFTIGSRRYFEGVISSFLTSGCAYVICCPLWALYSFLLPVSVLSLPYFLLSSGYELGLPTCVCFFSMVLDCETQL